MKNCEATATFMQVTYEDYWQEKTSWFIPKSTEPHQVGQKNQHWTTNGRVPLWCSLMRASLVFRLMMDVKDV